MPLEKRNSRVNLFWTRLGFALAFGLGMAIQTWAARQWPANFDSDEAIFGLMARHALQGRIPIYMYGPFHYLGSLESLLAAGFIKLFGSSVLVLRLSTLLLFGLFLISHGALVCRAWGKRVAFFSLLVLALPSWSILSLTIRPVGAFGAMLVTGTAGLLLWQARATGRLHYARLVAMGAVIGLGVWSHPMTVVYWAALGMVSWLRSPEWAKIHGWLLPRLRWPEAIFSALTLFGVGLVVLAFFSSGAVGAMLPVAQRAVRLLLLVLGGGACFALLGASSRRRHLLLGSAALALGFALGNGPQWTAWLLRGIVPSTALLPSCPADVPWRARLVGTQLLPAMWGVPLLPNLLRLDPAWVVLRTATLVLILTALLVFARIERSALWAVVSWRPLQETETSAVLWGLLFSLPLALAVLGGNTFDVKHVRYLLVSWQASSVILALLFSRLWAQARWWGVVCVVLWTLQLGLGDWVQAKRYWDLRNVSHSLEATAELEAFLGQRGVRGGYAEYWEAYALDFLTAERLIFAPYNMDRYPAYADEVAGLDVQAWLLPAEAIPADATTVEALRRALTGEEGRLADFYPPGAGPPSPWVLATLQGEAVRERQHVARWDVWLLENVRTQNYEGEGMLRQTGRVVADPAASGRQAVRGSARTDEAGWLAYGPYALFPRGAYRACFRLRAEGSGGPGVLTVLDVAGQQGQEILARRELSAAEVGRGGYAWTCLDFVNERHQSLEFRVYFLPAGDLWLDWVRVERLASDEMRIEGDAQ